MQRLEKGEDFAKVAAEVSTDTSNKDKGGDLGWFGKGAMVPEFETAAFGLKVGEISQPVKTQFGYHIIQVLAHGEVPLSADAYEQARQTAFNDWLTKARTKYKVVTYDNWQIDRSHGSGRTSRTVANEVDEETAAQWAAVSSSLALRTPAA